MSSSRTVSDKSQHSQFLIILTLGPSCWGFEVRGFSRINRTWALDVSDDGSGLIVHELNADLGDTTTRTYPTESEIYSTASSFHGDFF